MGVCSHRTLSLISILDQKFGEEVGAPCVLNSPESSLASLLGKSSVPVLKSPRAPLFKRGVEGDLAECHNVQVSETGR